MSADADAVALQSANVDDHRWGFEEADDWEYERLSSKPSPDPVKEPAETLVGQDPDGVVAVVVSPEAEVAEMRLSPEWRRSVDPWDLHSHVLSAANTATLRALAYNVERIESTPASEPGESRGAAEESALTSLDVQRLLDAVSAELGNFTERLSEIVDRPV